MASQALGAAAKLPLRALNEPLITGGLLYLLTRGPTNIRERILAPFQNNLLSVNGAARLAGVIFALKLLTVRGIFKRINEALTRFALNGWSFRRKGAPFEFGPEKKELVVLTGGSSGFGYEFVKGFVKIARVCAIDIQDFPEELAALPDVHFYNCDITDSPAIKAVCEQIRTEHGDASVLINNAGIANGKLVLDSTNEEQEKLIKVNLISHLYLIREFLPGMLSMKKGHIVTIASSASFFHVPGLLDYAISKAGALMLNDGIRAECLSRYENGESICTTSVHPYWHDTGMTNKPGYKEAIKKRGFTIDPPTNVTEVVIEQVVKAKSGRLIIPKNKEWQTGLRSWPVWAQDMMMGLHRRRKGAGGVLPKKAAQ